MVATRSIRIRQVLPGLLVVALAACASEPMAPESSPTPRRGAFEVGQTFPDLMLPSLEDGQPTSMRDYRGQKVVLHVFASW
jgi:hypothetical protein